MSQSAAPVPPSIDQSRPPLPGSGSDSVTLCAVPGPLLVTVIMNPMSSPASTESSSALLSITTSGHWTTTESESSPDPLAVEETVPVLLIVAHDAAVVGDEMCTVRVAPAASVPKSHVSVPLAMSQSAAPVPPSIDQSRPEFEGSVSESVTPVAGPEPVLDTVRVKPMSSPAETVASSASLVISTLPGTGLFVNVQVVMLPGSIVMLETVLPLLVPVLVPSSSLQLALSSVQSCGTDSATLVVSLDGMPNSSVWPDPVICLVMPPGWTVKSKTWVVATVATFLITRRPSPGLMMQSNGLLLPPLPADG
jgi:hypothetical protein